LEPPPEQSLERVSWRFRKKLPKRVEKDREGIGSREIPISEIPTK
jgi:hypothetical protein